MNHTDGNLNTQIPDFFILLKSKIKFCLVRYLVSQHTIIVS